VKQAAECNDGFEEYANSVDCDLDYDPREDDRQNDRMNDLIERNWPIIGQWLAEARRPRLVVDNTTVETDAASDRVRPVRAVARPAIFLEDGTMCDPATGEIRSLEQRVAPTAPASGSPIVEFALYYARLGWHVFPCGRKVPLTACDKDANGNKIRGTGGFYKATTDEDQIRSWWRQFPRALIGVRAGPESGIFVIDLDGTEGIANWSATVAKNSAVPQTHMHLTPGGGQHLVFKWREDRPVTNSPGQLKGLKIDVRGRGGYFIAPPSLAKNGKRYEVADQLNFFNFAEAPDWLYEILKKEQPAAPAESITGREKATINPPTDHYAALSAEGSRYIEAALRGEYNMLAAMPSNSGRNIQLNDSSLKLGHYVGGGVLEERKLIDTMLEACKANSSLAEDGPEACLATIESGLEAGKLEPKAIPERKVIPFPNGHKRGSSGIALSDFQAYLPMHNYIYIPTRDLWPGVAVDSQLPSVPLFNKDGSPRLKPTGEPVLMGATTWLDRNQAVAQMTWAPGEPMLVHGRLMAEGGWIDHPGVSCFNLYRPPTIRLGDATKAQQWVDHVHKVYPDDADHIITWLAYRVQHPESKINHCLVLGGKPGAGKDTLLEPVVQAVGPWNVGEASPKTLTGRFNGFLKSVLLRVSEARDTGEVNKFQMYETMKTINASPPFTLPVDEKNLKEHRIQNVVGAIITSNYKTESLYLPADDRRHYVAWSDRTISDFDSVPGAGDASLYFDAMWKWYEKEGGFEDIAAYLATLDVSGFNPKAPPDKTPAFWAIVDANRSTEESEIADVLDLIGNPPAITIERLIASAGSDLSEFLRERKNRKAVSHKIIEAGYEQVRTPTADDGLWRVNGARKAIYAQTSLPVPDRFKAAQQVAAGALWQGGRWVKPS
jgi:hypothetical protein